MKKTISLLMTVMMLFTCVGAMAEEAAPSSVKLVLSAEVNPDVALGLMSVMGGTEANENTRQIIHTVLAVLNKLSVAAALDLKEEKGALDLNLNDQKIGGFAGRIQDGKLQLISSLYPSYMVTADESYLAEAFGQLQLTDGANSTAAFLGALGESLAGVTAELEPIIDQPQKGDYTIEGAAFDTCTPAHLPISQLAKIVDQVLEGIEQNEEAQQALQGTGMDIAQMRQQLAEVIAGEQGKETLDFQVYTCEDGAEAENGNVYFTTQIAPEDGETSFNLAAGQVNGVLSAHVLFGSKEYKTEDELRTAASTGANAAVLDLYGQMGDEAVLFTLDATVSGVVIALHEKLEPANNGEGFKSTTDLYLFNRQQPLVTVSALLLTGEGQVDADFDGIALQAIDAKELEENEELQNLLLKDVQENGLNALLSAAQQVMPDEVSALMAILAPAPAEETGAIAE